MKVPRRLSGPGQRAAPEDDPRGRADGQQDGRLLPEALARRVGPRVDHLERTVRGDLQAVLQLPPGRGVVVRHRDLARGPGHVGADGEGGARVVFVVVAALWEMLQGDPSEWLKPLVDLVPTVLAVDGLLLQLPTAWAG